MISRFLVLLFAFTSLARLFAGEQPTRIVEYLYDGDGAKRRVSVTSDSAGTAIGTFAIAGKKPVTTEIPAEDFSRIWTAFTSLAQLQQGDITTSKVTVDTDTHHVFFTLEKSSAGSVSRQYAVLAADAGPELKAWLRLLEPREEKANQPSEPMPLKRHGSP